MANMQTLKERYELGRISEAMLKKYVLAGIITQEEFDEITEENKEDNE